MPTVVKRNKLLDSVVDQGGSKTHWQEDVTPIHEDHDDASHTREVSEVAPKHEDHGDNVVGHHLYVILSSGLSIENQDLV